MPLNSTATTPANGSASLSVFPAARESSEQGILYAGVRAATAFLGDTSLTDSLHTLLADIASATQASRAYVCKKKPAPEDAATVVRAEWTAPGIERFAPASLPLDALNARGSEGWLAALAAGEPFFAVTADLPQAMRARFEALRIQSTAAVPIFVQGDLWGFLGVDHCVAPRQWSGVEVDALSTAAVLVGSAIHRRRVEDALRAATVQAQLAADIGEVVTAAGDTIQQMLDRCSAAIVSRTQPDLVCIWMMDDGLESPTTCTAAGTASVLQGDVAVRMQQASPELARIASSASMIIWRDGLPDLWSGCQADYDADSLRAGVAFPLITNARAAGVMVLLGRAFPPDEMIAALASVTDEIALAIERHQAQSAATRMELRYRRLVAATVEGIVIHDGQRVVDANPSFAAMLGYTLEQVIGRHPFDFILPEYHALVRGNLISNYEHPYEVEGIRSDGTHFPVELKGSDYVDQGVKLRVAAVRDITDRKAVEKAAAQLSDEQQARALAEHTRAQAEFLAEASRILASSLDTTTTLAQLAHLAIPTLADYCVVSTFHEGRVERVAVVHADPERERILHDAVNAWPQVFPPSHPLFAALSNNQPYLASDVTDELISAMSVTPEHRAALVQLGPRSLMAVPISNAGVLMGSLILSSTRADHRYGSDDLALAQEFAHRAALALQAAHSYHLSQAASRARDEMLAVVAHDLRNPLNTIIMGSELVLEMAAQGSDAAAVRPIEIIRRSAEQMNRLIQDLLDAGRIDRGMLALEKAIVAPADLLREACDMLMPLAARAQIVFRVEYEPDLPAISGDRGRLLQVLSNLGGNALKFTPQGGSVWIRAAFVDDPSADERVIRFSVTDTGSGIPGDQLPHIFARGWQARRGDRRGIGLGLAIASGIVEAHGGRIWVDSSIGEGSTFTFTTPVARP